MTPTGAQPAALPHHTSVAAGVQAAGIGHGFTTGMARGIPFEVLAKASTVEPDSYGNYKLKLRVAKSAINSAAAPLKKACLADVECLRSHVKQALDHVTAEASEHATPDLTKRKVCFDLSSGELMVTRRHEWAGPPRVFKPNGATYTEITNDVDQFTAGTVILTGIKITSYINVGEAARWGVSGRFHNDIVVMHVPPVRSATQATLEAPPTGFNFKN